MDNTISVLFAEDSNLFVTSMPKHMQEMVERLSAKGALGVFNLEIVHGINGAEALEKFNDNLSEGKKFDFVLTDSSMPEMNGVDLAKKIKELDKNIPLYLYSFSPPKYIPKDLFEKVMEKASCYEPLQEIFAGIIQNKRDAINITRLEIANSSAKDIANSAKQKGTDQKPGLLNNRR